MYRIHIVILYRNRAFGLQDYRKFSIFNRFVVGSVIALTELCVRTWSQTCFLDVWSFRKIHLAFFINIQVNVWNRKYLGTLTQSVSVENVFNKRNLAVEEVCKRFHLNVCNVFKIKLNFNYSHHDKQYFFLKMNIFFSL